jgi:hypothetical protein
VGEKRGSGKWEEEKIFVRCKCNYMAKKVKNGMIPSDLEIIQNEGIANHDGSEKRDV